MYGFYPLENKNAGNLKLISALDFEYRPDDDFDYKALIREQKEQEQRENARRKYPELYKEFNKDDKETIEFEEIIVKSLPREFPFLLISVQGK
jgi:hypothetical protein